MRSRRRHSDDPFLEDALEGAVQLDSNAFDSDLKNLRSSLNERVSEERKNYIPVGLAGTELRPV